MSQSKFWSDPIFILFSSTWYIKSSKFKKHIQVVFLKYPLDIFIQIETIPLLVVKWCTLQRSKYALKLDSTKLSDYLSTRPGQLGCQILMLGKYDQTKPNMKGSMGMCQNSPPNIADGKESVEVVDGQAEDLRSTVLLLADLEHPVRHLLPHVRLQVCLDGIEIIFASGGVLHFPPYQSSQNSLIAKNIRITIRP